MSDKYQHNEQGKRHGYWEKYTSDGKKLWFICNYVNGEWYGYFEHHGCLIDYEYYAR